MEQFLEITLSSLTSLAITWIYGGVLLLSIYLLSRHSLKGDDDEKKK